MRQVLIDELGPADVEALHGFLRANATPSSLDGLYWVELTPDLLDAEQFACSADQPFCFAVEVGESWAKLEFLIRSRANFRSPHMRYAARSQQAFILEYAAHLIETLELKT